MQAELARERRRPRLRAPRTLVVMPDECQSMPITAPKDWNQNGWARRAQELVAAVVVDDRLGDHRAEPGHAVAEPGRHAAAVQGQVGAAGAGASWAAPYRNGRRTPPLSYGKPRQGKQVR